jgi:hypothetical protein
LHWFLVNLTLDGGQGVEELIGDVGENGRTARGDAILHDENEELGEEEIDIVSGLEVIELEEEISGEIGVNRLIGLQLQGSVAKAESGADGAAAATASPDGKMAAAIRRLRMSVARAGESGDAGIGCIHVGFLFWDQAVRGTTPDR